MTLSELKTKILVGNLPKFFIFAGQELVVMDTYIAKIAEKMNLEVSRIDNIRDNLVAIQAKSTIGKNKCFVVRDDKSLATNESLMADLSSELVQGNNVIILIFTDIDKRSKLHKNYSDSIILFDKITTEILEKYAIREGMEVRTAQWFAYCCNENYGIYLMELDKVKQIASARNISIEKAAGVAISEQLISEPNHFDIYGFIRAVACRQEETVFNWYDEFVKNGQNELGFITLLYNTMKSILLYSADPGGAGICERTGLTPFQAKTAGGYGKHYTIPELICALRLLQLVESGIKLGSIPVDLSIPYILVTLIPRRSADA